MFVPNIHFSSSLATTIHVVSQQTHCRPILLAREPLPCPPDALQILLRDDSVLVVAKPNGLPVMHSELYYQHTVMETLKRMAEKEVCVCIYICMWMYNVTVVSVGAWVHLCMYVVCDGVHVCVYIKISGFERAT